MVNGRGGAVVCPKLETAGQEISMKHLRKHGLFSERCDVCRDCSACAEFIPATFSEKREVVSREKVRPHGWRATQEKTIRRVSSGMGG